MRRALATLLVAVPAAAIALLLVSTPTTAQPVPPPGLRSVQHGSAFTGSGTTAAPLNLAPQACSGSGSAVAGWGSDGTPTCVAAGATYTAGDGIDVTGSTISADLPGGTCVLGQVMWSLGPTGIADCRDENGDIEGITTTSPLSGGCTSGTCALTTSMSSARLLGRTSASTGVVEQLTGTQATAMLDAFTSSLAGLVPASGGGTSKFLRADATWQTPPDADHALVTSGVVPMGDGTGQVASGITSDGTNVTHAGDTDLSAGTTTVGRVDGTVQTVSTTGTIDDLALDADTTVLRLDGGALTTITGITGGYDGRVLFVVSPNSALSTRGILAHEGATSTLADRIANANAASQIYVDGVVTMLVYDGNASRWRNGGERSLYQLAVASTASVGSALTVGGQVTSGQVRVTTGNVSSYINSNTATPTSTAFQVTNNSTSGGYLTSTPLDRDDDHLGFDAEYVSSTWTARDTSWASIVKHGDALKILCGSGATAGASIATAYAAALSTPCLMLDLATGALNAPGAATFGADGTLGTNGSNTWTINAMARLSTGIATKSTSGPTASGCGTGPVVVGSRTLGHVTLGTGASGCTLTFEDAFSSTPTCIVQSQLSSERYSYSYTVSTTAITLTTASAGAIYDWICGDHF